eukprot:CAMPEP_0175256298 /NCGR_PEP_ID=MMETSP0093-20121207/38138_1 /TAXON_ID=311494 /ORGANISM="Alexandrium monilatum, Strain CCMP3105" /LENGTH=32 /DNA_ID= /DNA_START= /DNA_END= /DNA_ORIENTATION=
MAGARGVAAGLVPTPVGKRGERRGGRGAWRLE